MNINRIYLKHFRNYREETVRFTPNINVLIGQNGQGKTNILEAIYYLATGKSYRVHREQELIQWGETGFLLKGDFTIAGRPVSLESVYHRGKHKAIKVNDVPCQKLSEFIGTVNIVFFSPDDLVLVKGAPSERRRFLDMHIAQMRPAYVSVLNQYNRILRQKSALLKQTMLSKQEKANLLRLWNEQLIPLGTAIMQQRFEYAHRLLLKASEIYSNLSSHREKINLKYTALGCEDLQQAIALYPDYLEESVEREIERQSVLVGPHRDDLVIEFNDRSGRLYGSQGQQRSLVLSLKLAELELVHEQKGVYPILLLDDVLSELDAIRRKYLMEFIQSSANQTLMTMTSAEKSVLQAGTSVFRVESGTIRREI